MSELILTRDAGAIRYLTLNRPDKLNAMNNPLVSQLSAALRAAEDDPHVSVVVLAGAGRAFCAGADLGGEGRRARHHCHPRRARSAPASTAPCASTAPSSAWTRR